MKSGAPPAHESHKTGSMYIDKGAPFQFQEGFPAVLGFNSETCLMDGKTEPAMCALGLFGLQGCCAGPAVTAYRFGCACCCCCSSHGAAAVCLLCAVDLLRHPGCPAL